MKKAATVTNWATAMIACRCGDVFQAAGKPESVRRKQKAWQSKHENCAEVKREGCKVFWLSFCDAERPKNEQFRGACIVEVTAEEADDAAIDVALRFPLAQPGAEWIAAATQKAWRLGCNPGGEVASIEIPPDEPRLSLYTFGVLMDKAAIKAIDRSALQLPRKQLVQ